MLLGEFVLFFFFFLQKFSSINIWNWLGHNGFGTVGEVDAGYYAQGFFLFKRNQFSENLDKNSKKIKRSLHYIQSRICRKVLSTDSQSICNWVCDSWKSISCDWASTSAFELSWETNKHWLSISFHFWYISLSFHFFITPIKIVDGRDTTKTAFPITKVEQLNEDWIADELVVHESQIYPSYIVYTSWNFEPKFIPEMMYTHRSICR